MEGFKNRYYLLISTVFLIFLVLGLNKNITFLWVIFVFLLSLSFLILSKIGIKNKNLKTVFILMFIASLLGFSRSSVLRLKLDGIEDDYSGEHKVIGYIKEISSSYAYMSESVIHIEGIDGETVSIDAVMVTDFAIEAEIGDALECTTVISALRTYEDIGFLKNKNQYDTPLICIIDNENDFKITGEKQSVYFTLIKLNSSLSSMLKANLGSKNGALASALLLGNKELLDDSLLRDFKRAGAYHMLALSGLHVAILIGLFDFLLKKSRMNRYVRIAILSCLVIFYVALTGFKLSACRAMLMLLMVYVSYVVRAKSDPMTALFVSISVIGILFPASLLDLGLQLSFLSTFGVIAASTVNGKLVFLNKKTSTSAIRLKIIMMLRYLVKLIITAVCVFIATLPLIMIYFGEVSIITFISNLFMGALCELFMVLSILSLIFSGIFSYMASVIGNIISIIIGSLASIDGAMISLVYPHSEYIIWGLFLFSLILFAVKLNKKWILALPGIVFTVLFCINVYAYDVSRADTVSIEYYVGDVLVLSSSDEVYICDDSNGRYGRIYYGTFLAKQNCFTEIDGIILTHYHSYHTASLKLLTNNFVVKSIFIPVPQNKDEAMIMSAIAMSLENSDVDIYVYDAMTELDILGGKLVVSERAYSSDYAHPSVALTFVYGDKRASLVGMPYFNTYLESNEIFSSYIKNSNVIIFGADGKSCDQRFSIFDSLNRETEVVFTDRKVMLLSDFEPYIEDFNIYVDVEYKKYDLK